MTLLIKSTEIFVKISFLLLLLVKLNSCGFYRPVSAKDYPPEPEKRVQKNLQEGRGFTIMGGINKNKGGKFDFATSNEMWRAAIEILDFVPLSTADYGGGIIITDWYSEDLNSNESIKIMINFLSNEIRAEWLNIKVYKKICKQNSNCNTQLIKSNIDNDIKLAVLKKAAQIKKQDGKKRAKDKNYTTVPSSKE